MSETLLLALENGVPNDNEAVGGGGWLDSLILLSQQHPEKSVLISRRP